MKVVFLDTGVLGIVTHPGASAESKDCVSWMRTLLAAGVRICIAEVCDYELRREYVRRQRRDEEQAAVALSNLNALSAQLEYVPINTPAMREAAELWAAARNRGRSTADPKRLDVDVILCAQAKLAAGVGKALVIATTNVRHLSNYVSAESWRNVRPN